MNIQVGNGINRNATYLSVTDDGGHTDLYYADDASGRQRWILRPGPDGKWFNILIAGGVPNGRKYLSASPDGSKIDLSPVDDGSGRQRWIIEKVPSGLSHIRNFAGVQGNRKYLSANADGTLVDLFYFDDNSGRQVWRLFQPGSDADPIVRAAKRADAAPAPVLPARSNDPNDPAYGVESLVDVEKPDTKLDSAPALAPQWQPKKNPIAGFNLSGTWQTEIGSPSHVEKVAVYQFRDMVEIYNLDGRPFFLKQGLLMAANYTAAGVAKGNMLIVDQGVHMMGHDEATITVSNADHFKMTDDKFLVIQNAAYRRVSSIAIPDVPCDARKPSQLSPEVALEIANIDARFNDWPSANCWYYLSAMAGNADAAASYGESLIKGRGIPKNLDQGTAWAQRSAMRGSPIGSNLIEYMFLHGVGVPVSNQRHSYWDARTMGTSPMVIHDVQEHALRNWMLDTSEPCKPENPTRVNADDALKMGRVAFEARALQTAHCWFTISAHQGNTKAYTYLGILSAFGLGVQPNSRHALAYMMKAARGHDADAGVYLANFYRYGVGTKPDDSTARNIMRWAMDLPGGDEAFARLQGSLVNEAAWGVLAAPVYEPDHNCIYREEHRQGGNTANCYDPAAAADAKAGQDAAANRLKQASNRTALDDGEEVFPEPPPWPHF